MDSVLVAQAKGAALVEANAADYVSYLQSVFADNPRLCRDIEVWGEEERLHGAALRRWCDLADPEYDFDAAMARFRAAYRVPLHADVSVRGDRARELVARCVVEIGTTTYYSALRDATSEPLLKEICRRIAGDEVRHFQLFLKYLNDHYAQEDELSHMARLKTIWQRVNELDDPELTFAYFAANEGDEFDPDQYADYSRRFMSETTKLYHLQHFKTSVPMLGKVAGIAVKPWMTTSLGHMIQSAMRYRYRSRESQMKS